ncbi:MAG: YceI family protein, partial [Marinomonas sp.]
DSLIYTKCVGYCCNLSFTQLNGQLSEQGELNIEVDLTSAETMIPIRNERLTKFVFEAIDYPNAILTADLSEHISNIDKEGVHIIKGIDAELDFHGNKKAIKVDVLVTSTEEDILTVSSLQPVIINSKDFAVTKGIKKLQELAKLPSIATAVPVTFALTFSED